MLWSALHGTTTQILYTLLQIEKVIDGDKTLYEYNSLQHLTRAVNQESVMEITYDDSGLPLHVQYSHGHSVTYRYNSLNQRVYVGDSSTGFGVSFSYNGQDMLSEVKLEKTGEIVAQYEYGLSGELNRRILGSGAYTTYKYEDGSFRLLELSNHLPNGTLSTFFSYQYDKRGRVISLSTISGNWTYVYDAAEQLIGWTTPSGDTTSITYDSRGNRIVTTDRGDEKGYSVNNLNQYMTFSNTDTFTHDRNGNLKEKNAGEEVEQYTFNAVGQLIETATVDKRSQCRISLSLTYTTMCGSELIRACKYAYIGFSFS